MASEQDLLIVMDATASMGNYLNALRQSVPEIIALSALSGAFERVAVLAYRDYNEVEATRILWSGWDCPDVAQFASNILPRTTGAHMDEPEAAKTALNLVIQHCTEDRHTLVLWYADAPPHRASSNTHNAVKERSLYPGDASDWVKLSYKAAKHNCRIFSFIPRAFTTLDSLFYVFLSQVTGGRCIVSIARDSTEISRMTLDIILQRMGVPLDASGTDENPRTLWEANVRYYDLSPLDANPKPSSEGEGWLEYSNADGTPSLHNSATTRALDLSSDIPVSSIAPSSRFHNLAKRFADPAEANYRATVHATLAAVIDANVYALTYNPIFGQLWRAVCKEHDSDAKQKLVDAFSHRVSQISNAQQKTDMQQWLEDSFDATEEINEIIVRVDAEAPRVYLDLDSEVEMTRKELLEVSKSCHSGVLRKLSSIFTHLKIVEKNAVLEPNQRSIPLTLPPRDFFRLLPHLVVSGTLYPKRAASLTAILALVTGVSFLQESATALLAPLKGTWIDLEVPENVSFDCARFLLSAPLGLVLTDEERAVYDAMRRYKLVELNLDAPLAVHLPWTPEKTRQVGDERIKCNNCHLWRSVTIMSHDRPGACGLCVTNEVPAKDHTETDTPSKPDEMESCWVECSVKSCRAQYVVEKVANLNVRPKCHYCRVRVPCPYIECTRCTNRIIVPATYRSADETAYLCPGCANPSCAQATISTSEVSVRALIADNGVAWLDMRDNPGTLQGKSAFKLMQAHGVKFFDVVPRDGAQPLALTCRGKRVHNADDVKAQLQRRVGRGEVVLGTCPLCFGDWPHDKLSPACGRSKCAHRVNDACLAQWYGRNEPGKLLNLMQFSCPFCRRAPATKVLARYNRRAAALGGLKDALSDARWYYAWCVNCGFAKRALERGYCEDERLPALDNFRCADCTVTTAIGNLSVSASNGPVAPLRVVPCPQCGVMVEKTDGCNHIECQCGQHFCFVCGEGHDLADIYQHMAHDHGGIYDDEDGDDDE